jgi:hypothetical protein
MKRLLLTMAVCLLGFSLSARSGLEDFPGNYPDTAGRLSLFSPTLHLPSQNLTQDSINIGYTYWFDEDYAHRQQGNLSNGHLLIDASTLADGIHTLYMQLGYGTAAQLESFMFYSYHTPPELSQDSFNINYTYWFDEDYAHRQQGSLSYGNLMIDASALTEGFHTVYMQLGHGTDARLEKYIFYIPPERFYEEYSDMVYWFGDDTTVHRLTPLAGTHLMEVPEMDCGAQGIVHLMAQRVADRTAELRRLSEDHRPTITLSRADEFAHPQHPRNLSSHPRNVRVLPKSRDFH